MQLFEDLGNQIYDVLVAVFGQEFLKWGIRSNDRKVNRDIKKYCEYLTYFIKNRISEIQESERKNNKEEILDEEK